MKVSTLFFSVMFLAAIQFMGPAARRPLRSGSILCVHGHGRKVRPEWGSSLDRPGPKAGNGTAPETRRLREVKDARRRASSALRGIEKEEERIRKVLGLGGSTGPLDGLVAGVPSGARDEGAMLLTRLESLERQRLAWEELLSGLDLEASLLARGRGHASPDRSVRRTVRY